MLVNASSFPGPALWQGLMLIVCVFWGVYVFTGNRTMRQVNVSLAVVLGVGIGLFVWIVS